MRICTLLLILVCATVFASSPSHETQAPTLSKSEESTKATMTRQEALIQGLSSLNLNPKILEKIIDFTRRNLNLDSNRFNSFIDSLLKEEGSIFDEGQAQKLKELFQKELGAVESLERGTEFGSAAQKVLNQKNVNTPSLNSTTKNQQVPIDLALLSKLLEGANKKEDSKDNLDKLLLPLQELIKSLGGNQLGPQEGKVRGGIPRSLLDTLRGDPKDKNDKDADDKLAEGLKDALNKHAPPPPSGKGNDIDPQKDMGPPPFKGEPKKNSEETPKMTASKSSSDKDKKDDKGENKKDPLNLSSKSEKDKEKEPEPTKKEEPKDFFSKNLENSSLFNDLANQTKTPPPLEKESQAVIGSDSGSSSKGGNWEMAGSGSSGPSFSTLGGSAPSTGGASFDGDPFSGIGKSYYGGGPFTYDFTKNVEYSSAVGDISTENDSPYFVGGNTTYSSEDNSKNKNRNVSYQIVGTGKEQTKPNSVLSFVGVIGKNLCNGSWKSDLELCSLTKKK